MFLTDMTVEAPVGLPAGIVVTQIQWVIVDENDNVVFSYTGTEYTIEVSILNFVSGYLTVTFIINDGVADIPYPVPRVAVHKGMDITVADVWCYAPRVLVEETYVPHRVLDITVESPSFWFGSATHIATSYIITDLSGNPLLSRLNDSEHLLGIRLEIPEVTVDAYLLQVEYIFDIPVNLPTSKILRAINGSKINQGITIIPDTVSSLLDTVLSVSYGNNALTNVSFSIVVPSKGTVSTGVNFNDTITVSTIGLANEIQAQLYITGLTFTSQPISDVIDINITN